MRIPFFYTIAFVSFLGAAWSAPVQAISYIEDLKVSYEEGDPSQWFCGILVCPAGTQGCRLQLKNDKEDPEIMRKEFFCLDGNKGHIMTGSVVTDIAPHRKVDIDLETYEGAESVYSTGYGMGGNENAQGIVAPHDWDQLKKSAARNKARVEQNLDA